MQISDLTLEIEQQIEIASAPGTVFTTLLDQLAGASTAPDGSPMPLVLEAWPGGRWFRDLGDKAGHLWGFVQVIKPPTVIEIQGPLFMSYPVAGHLQVQLEPISGGTQLTLRHRAFGMIEDNHRENVIKGWGYKLETLKQACA